MPEIPYSDDVYAILKQVGGSKFTMPLSDFRQKIESDDAYISDVYSILKSTGGDKFILTPDEFTAKVKKKDVSGGTSQDSGTGTIPLSQAKNLFGETVGEELLKKAAIAQANKLEPLTDQEAARQGKLSILTSINPGLPMAWDAWATIKDKFERQIPSWYHAHMAKGIYSSPSGVEDKKAQLEKIKNLPDDQEIMVESDIPAMASPTGIVLSRPPVKMKVGELKNKLQTDISTYKGDFVNELDKALTAWQKESDVLTTDDIRKVKSPDEFIGWFGTAVGNALSSIPLSLMTLGAESILAESGLTYLDGIVKKAQELSQKEGKIVTPQQVIERGEDGYAYAMAFGGVAGGLDFLGALGGATGIVKSIGASTLKKAAQSLVTGSLIEGGTEPIQNFLNDMGQYYQLGGQNFVEALKKGVEGIPRGLSEGFSAFTGNLALGGLGMTSRMVSTENRVNFPEGDLKKPSEISNFVEKTDALSKQETGQVDVRQQTTNGETVGEGNQLQEPAGTGVQETPQTQEVTPSKSVGIQEKPSESTVQWESPIVSKKKEKFIIKNFVKLRDDGDTEVVNEGVEGFSVKIPRYPNLELFVYKNKSGQYVLTEARTGAKLSEGNTIKDVVSETEDVLLWQQSYNKEYPSIYQQVNNIIDARNIDSEKYIDDGVYKPTVDEQINSLEKRKKKAQEEILNKQKQSKYTFGGSVNTAFEEQIISGIDKRIEEIKKESEISTTIEPRIQEKLSNAVTNFLGTRVAEQPVSETETQVTQPDLAQMITDQGIDASVTEMLDGGQVIYLNDPQGNIASSIRISDTLPDSLPEKGHFVVRTTDTPEKINETINQALEYGKLTDVAQPEVVAETLVPTEVVQPKEAVPETPVTPEIGQTGTSPTETIPTTEEKKERQSKVVQDRKESLSDEARYYEPITNEGTLQKANELIDKYGEADADRLFRDDKSGTPVALRKAIGYSLLDRASKVGDFEREISIGEGLATIETEAGQGLQSSQIYHKMSPGAQVLTVDKGMKQTRAKKIKRNIGRIGKVKSEIDSVNKQVAEDITKSPTKKNIFDKLNKRKENREKKVKEAIAKLDALKIKINGKLNDISQVVGAEIYNGAIDVIEAAIQAGASVANAVDQAVAFIQANFKEAWPEAEFRTSIFQAIGSLGTDPYRTLVKKGLKEMGADLDQVVQEHYSKAQIVKADLIKSLSERLGIPETDAQEFANTIDTEFTKLATERKQKIVQRILGRKALDKVQQVNVDKLIEASNVGVLDESQFRDQYADLMKWPKLTEEQAAEIRRLSTIAQEKPEGQQRLNATNDLMKYVANLNGIEWGEVAKAIWYANMLSGPSTQALNIYANAGEVAAEAYVTMIYEASKMIHGQKGINLGHIFMSLWNSMPRALSSAWDVLHTGRRPYKGSDKIGFPSIVEFKKFKGGVFNPLNNIKFVSRLMTAMDIMSFRQLQGLRSAQLSNAIAFNENKTSPTKDIRKRASEIVNKSSDQVALFKQQAIDEGFKEGTGDYKRRVWELMEFNSPQELQDDVNDFAAYGTFNHPSEHTLGEMIKLLNRFISIFPPFRAVAPFTNVVGNIANRRLDWFPVVGLVRAAKGGKGFNWEFIGGKNYFIPYKGDERARVAIKAATGTLAMTGLWFLVSSAMEDEDEKGNKRPFVEITSNGPIDRGKQYELMQSGWRPHSIRIGNRWFKFQNSPLALPLEVIGALKDREKYFGDKVEGMDAKMELAMLATAQFWTDMSFLQGMSNFLSIFDKNDPLNYSEHKAEAFFTRFVKSTIVPNALTQTSQIIQQIYDIPMKDANNLLDNLIRDIPALRDNLNNIYNSLGEPVKANVLEKLIPSGVHKAETKGSLAWDVIINNQAWIGLPDKNQEVYFADEGLKRTMTEDEYTKYALMSGFWTRKLMEDNLELINQVSEKYDRAITKKVIYRLRDGARSIARAQLFAGVDIDSVQNKVIQQFKAEANKLLSEVK